jgi:hypothetical protein
MERLQTHIDGVTRDMTPEEEKDHLARQAALPSVDLPPPQPSEPLVKTILDILVRGGLLAEAEAAHILSEIG